MKEALSQGEDRIAWSGPDRRQFTERLCAMRVWASPGGRAIDIGEGGLAGEQNPPKQGDVVLVEA